MFNEQHNHSTPLQISFRRHTPRSHNGRRLFFLSSNKFFDWLDQNVFFAVQQTIGLDAGQRHATTASKSPQGVPSLIRICKEKGYSLIWALGKMRAILERYTPKLNSSNILEHVYYDISDTVSISVFRLKQNCFYSVTVLCSHKKLPLYYYRACTK